MTVRFLTILCLLLILFYVRPRRVRAQATATQAILTYTAGNTSQCTVEVSTSASYSPVVYAVDSAKFTNANMDGQTNASARTFVVGQRTVAQENVSPPAITVAGGNAARVPLTIPAGGPSYGQITVTFTSQPFVVGDNITVTGMTNTAYNTTWARVITASTNSFVYWVTASGTDTSGGATITRANRYSLALQTNTAYFYRLGGVSNTCAASPATGTFTTMNFPNGDTWPENFPTDSSGNWETPTIPESQAGTVSVIDPITGLSAKPMSLYSDSGSVLGDVTVASGGGVHHCSYQADGNSFFHCYLSFNGGAVLYGLNESTGEVRFLGNMQLTSGTTGCAGTDNPDPNVSSVWDASDANIWYGVCKTSTPTLIAYKATYTGNDVAVTGNTNVTATASNLTASPTLDALIHTFDSTFTASLFESSLSVFVNTHYALITLFRWNQGSPAWFVTFDLSNNTVVAATSSWGNAQNGSCGGALPTPCSAFSYRRWLGVHGQGDIGATAQNWTGFSGEDMNGSGAMGWFVETLNQGGGMNNTDTSSTITVTSTMVGSCGGSTGDPASQTTPPDGCNFLDQARPGDIFKFQDAGNEIVMVTARSSATSLTVARGCTSTGSPNWSWTCNGTGKVAHSNGATMFALSTEDGDVNATFNEWNFANDAHGTDTSQTNMIWDTTLITGHFGVHIPHMTDESWATKSSATWNTAFMTAGPDFYLSKEPIFQSQVLSCTGNSCDPYVHYAPYPATGIDYAWDTREWNGGPYSDTATVVSSGSGYVIERYNLASGHTFDPDLPYFSMDGGIKLKDISGTSAALTASSAGNYTLCIVSIAGECVGGSTVGQIYANLPASELSCTTQSAFGTSVYTPDWCVNNFFPNATGIMQLGLVAANQLGTLNSLPVYGMGKSRKLGLGLFKPPRGNQPSVVISTADQSWILYDSCVADPYLGVGGSQECLTEVMLGKVPAQPPTDGIGRSTFETVGVVVGAGSGGATHARVKFGFEENEPTKSTTWPPTINFYCTQYQGACYYQSGNFSNPVAANATSLTLSATSTLSIGIPQRVLFYQIEYLNGGGSVVATGPLTEVLTDSSLATHALTATGMILTGAHN